jgi:hypothetical protein
VPGVEDFREFDRQRVDGLVEGRVKS